MCMLDEIRAKRDEIYAIAMRHKAEKFCVFGSCSRKEGPSDAIHLASAKHAECDWFLTVDRGNLKKVNLIEKMRVANPLAFIQEMNP